MKRLEHWMGIQLEQEFCTELAILSRLCHKHNWTLDRV